jgi:hypothetical protein
MQFEISMTFDGEEKTELAKSRRLLASTATWHQNYTNSDHTQKPSNARPTQLNANIEQTTAATDAKVAIVFADRMTEPFVGNNQILFDDSCSIMVRIRHDKQTSRLWLRCHIKEYACLQKPAFTPRSGRIVGGIWRMYRLPSGSAKRYLAAAAALVLPALVVLWLGIRGSPPQSARDFEECVEQVEAKLPSIDQRGALRTDCNARFAGRRKAGGGYTYYDFMQDRKFDIVGPNPTGEERKEIDRAYMGFLDAQRREAVSAELAKKQNEQLHADMESARQPVGPPMELTPTNLPPIAAKRPVDRSKSTRCEDGSLSCSWAKLSAVVKNAFASSSKTKP